MDDIKNLTSEQALKNLRAAGYTKQADAFEKNLKGITTVSADKIGNTTPNVPTPQPQKNTDLSLGVLSSGASMGNFQDITQEDILSQKAGLYTKVMDLLNQTKGESKRKGELLEDEGAFDLKKQITGYQNQLAAEERAFEVERRRLMENPEGVFGAGVLQGQISNLESKSLQRRADIAILGNAAANNLQTALDIVDMKIDNEFGPAKEELNIFKQQLEFASPFLGEISSYLKDQADEKEKKIKEQQAWKKEIANLAIEAQKAGNTSMAQSLMSMTNGEVTEDSYMNAVTRAVQSGVYSPKAKEGLSQYDQDIEDMASQIYTEQLDKETAIRVLQRRYPNKSPEQIRSELDFILVSPTVETDLGGDINDVANDYGFSAEGTGSGARSFLNTVGQGAAYFTSPTLSRTTGNKSSFQEDLISGGKKFISGFFK
jgi:hypothetical protein